MDKVDLINYRMLAREVRQLRDQLMALEASLFSPTGQRFSSVPRSASGPKKTMEDAVAGHLKLQELYSGKLAAQEALLFKIEEALDSLDDPAQRVILRERYVLGNSWVRICDKMRSQGYSERQVYRLHGYALLHLKGVDVTTEERSTSAESAELQFARDFIHSHGLEFALASAWQRRKDSGT